MLGATIIHHAKFTVPHYDDKLFGTLVMLVVGLVGLFSLSDIMVIIHLSLSS